ncbi:MAG: LytTR family DNA-binding domain-containing protein [Vicingaceae bacterium]
MIRTVIIDDEKGARNVIRELLQRLCPQVEVVGEGDSVESGYDIINKTDPDLVLLDVEMPGGSGFNILERYDEVDFKTIFITAYDQYSLKAIKASALDYVLKPIDSAELVNAIKKADKGDKKSENMKSLMANVQSNDGIKKLAIASTGKITFLDIESIVRCEAEGSYTYIFTQDGVKHLSSKPIKEYEDLLTDRYFFRIHRSHLINLHMVDHYKKGERDIVTLKDKSVVEVSRKKRSLFVQAMGKVFL